MPEGRNSIFVFLVPKIRVTQIAVEHGHVAPDRNRLLIRLYGLLVFLALIPNRADIVFRVGVPRIDFDGSLVILQRQPQRFLLVQRDAQLVQIDGISRILVGEFLEDLRGLAILLANHVQVAHLLVGDFRAHHDYRVLRRRHLRHTGRHHASTRIFE